MLIGTEPLLIDSLAAGLMEDCPYGDITTEILGLDGQGRFRFISRLLVGVAGGITLANVKNYASCVDIIVLSSVLYAPPLDITCKITRL